MLEDMCVAVAELACVKFQVSKKKFPPGIEPGTLCVWSTRDNHYTTETHLTNLTFYCLHMIMQLLDLRSEDGALDFQIKGTRYIETE